MYSMDNIKLDRDILKLIAVVTMFIDHIGSIIFPHIMFLRIIGRISFPIFAFMIAEGCLHTSNKIKYFINLLMFGFATQFIKIIFNDNDDLNIMFTFAAAVMIIFVYDIFIDSCKNNNAKSAVYSVLLLVVIIAAVYCINLKIPFQYEIYGCTAPLIIYLSKYIKYNDLNALHIKILLLILALTSIYMYYGGVQIYAYLSVFVLMLYSGKKGKILPKYFFYAFYPLHLLLIYSIKYLI